MTVVKFPHLLNHMEYMENIVKSLIERIACGDPPFLSHLDKNILSFGNNSHDLMKSSSKDLNCFLRETISIIEGEKFTTWKDIKKKSIRYVLLYKYCKDRNISMLTMYLNIQNKKIIMDSENILL